MFAQIEAAKTFTDQYGQYAFGVASVIILMAALSFFWKMVFAPALETVLKISQSHERTSMALDRALERVERDSPSRNRAAAQEER